MRCAGWVAVAALALLGCAPDKDESTGPVIAMAPSDEDRPYPLASVSGLLRLEDGCLTVDGHPVFWPSGTGWDAERQVVTFGDDFEGAAPWAVDAPVKGGGGLVSPSDLVGDVLASGGLERLKSCAARLEDDLVTLVVPPWPQAESADPLGE